MTVIEQLSSLRQQIAVMSEVVGVAKQQLQTLQQVSSAIRDVKSIAADGVQGLLGSASDALGLKDVFALGKEIQATYTDGMNLYKDVKALPEEAKYQLAQLGLAVKDVQAYLEHGAVYDAFQGMDIGDWRKVFKDPIDALSTGTVGRAVVATEGYLDTEGMRRQYIDKLSAMTPEERSSMSGMVGVDMALLDFGAWAKGLEKRITNSLNYTVVADKIADAALRQNTVTGAIATNNAATIALLKSNAEKMRNDAEADRQKVMPAAISSVTGAKREDREQTTLDASTATATP